jgi:hypothetical protein
MFPVESHSLSELYEVGSFLQGDTKRPQRLATAGASLHDIFFSGTPTDWEYGGIALNDTSQGLMYREWEFRYEGSTIIVVPSEGGNASVVVSDITGVTELAGTFDQNMNPVVAYVKSGVTKLYWWNASLATPAHVTTSFPGAYSPRLCLDDKRPSQVDSSDVLFFYLKDGKLYYRQQRDRYETAYALCDIPPRVTRLGRVGMADINRLQIEFLSPGS